MLALFNDRHRNRIVNPPTLDSFHHRIHIQRLGWRFRGGLVNLAYPLMRQLSKVHSEALQIIPHFLPRKIGNLFLRNEPLFSAPVKAQSIRFIIAHGGNVFTPILPGYTRAC